MHFNGAISSSGPTAYPTRQPVQLNVLPTENTDNVRSHISSTMFCIQNAPVRPCTCANAPKTNKANLARRPCVRGLLLARTETPCVHKPRPIRQQDWDTCELLQQPIVKHRTQSEPGAPITLQDEMNNHLLQFDSRHQLSIRAGRGVEKKYSRFVREGTVKSLSAEVSE